MKLREILLLYLFICTIVVADEDDIEVDDPDVIKLTSANFDDITSSSDLMLVEFYAPWCGHCKALAPKYAEAASKLKNDHNIQLAKLNAVKYRDIANKFDISGYPTLKIFRDYGRKITDYDGGIEVNDMVNYMSRQKGPAAKLVKSIDDMNDWIDKKHDNENFHIFGVFKKTTNSQLKSSFLVIAPRLRTEYTFLITNNEEIINKYGEGIFALKNYDDHKMVKYTDSTHTKTVEKWIRSNSLPKIGNYVEENKKDYAKLSNFMHVGILFTKSNINLDKTATGYSRYIMNRIRPLTEKYTNIKFCIGQINDENNKAEIDEFGQVDDDNLFIIRYQNENYKFEDKFNKLNLLTFVQNVLDGKVLKHIKSEPIPKDNNGAVKIITGRTFDELVKNNDEHDVLIEFYAPWCGHCKALEPKYQKVGRIFKKKYDSNVIIAKLDATANDYPADIYDVSGYPTLYFKPAGAKTPILYEGERETRDIIKFVKQNAKKSIKRRHKRNK